MRSDDARALLLTGTVGSGKTAVAEEIGEILGGRGIATAVVDLDWLGWFHASPDTPVAPHELIARNLAAVWPNFKVAGATRLALARALQNDGELEMYAGALPGVGLDVVRLAVSPDTIERRLRSRDSGAILEGHLAEARPMTARLDALGLRAIEVDNDARPVSEVALDVLGRVGWL